MTRRPRCSPTPPTACARPAPARCTGCSFTAKRAAPGWQLQVICSHEDIDRLQTIIFLETTTNGIRRQVMERVCLPRRFEQVATPWGEVSVKVATLPDGSERAAPEYEDCARLAREHDVPLQRVMQAAQSAALRFE